MKTAIWTVNGKEYHLKMKSRQCGMLETKIGNPLNMMLRIERDSILPALPQMVMILTHGLIMYHPGINENKVYDLIDTWLEEGHAHMELMEIVTDVLKVSGYIPLDEDEAAPLVMNEG